MVCQIVMRYFVYYDCLCTHTNSCMFVYMHVYVCMHECMCGCIDVCMYVLIYLLCTYVCMYVCMNIYLYVCIYDCMYVYMYECSMYVWLYVSAQWLGECNEIDDDDHLPAYVFESRLFSELNPQRSTCSSAVRTSSTNSTY
jgi:hypothetical protein